ncbi:MerR family transcriptional regulator [Lolliginicoccus suaedae]|uniref:MerR family transcriptional regulator n=1 Tax=Lolliginicoccus suaedae TaxID=2605429 RepID=UPI0011F04DA6|nr:MerR family transcriptional regulator [Lolliginicoccus suaedae]
MGNDNAAHVQIGRAAELTGLSIRTLRHYEEVGLVTPSARSEGGFRLYSRDDIDRLLVIRRMKPLGFTLEQMAQLLAALDSLASSEAGAGARRAAAEVLAEFKSSAQDAVDRLRVQLEYAEELTGLLGEHVANARRSDEPGASAVRHA